MTSETITEITATGVTLAEAMAETLNDVIRLSTAPIDDASLAIPLRARRPDPVALLGTLLDELLAEINEGAQIASVEVDGLMKREGEFISWGYAYAAPARGTPQTSVLTRRDLTISEEPGRVTIQLTLGRADT